MAIQKTELDEVVQILKNIANDLEECGVEEWENFSDCVTATRSNLAVDCESIGKSRR